MRFNRIAAVLKKQMYETAQNKSIIISFLIFPIITILFTLFNLGTTELYRFQFVMNISTVFVSIIPLTIINNIISEDKYSNVTRMLLISNVKPIEYLIGITFHILLVSSIIALFFGIIGGLAGISLLWYVLILMLGVLTSLVLGGLISTLSKSNSIATAFVSLIGILNGFIPILASSNKTLMKFAKFWYTTQIKDLIGDISDSFYLNVPFRLVVVLINLIIFIILFAIFFKKNKLITK